MENPAHRASRDQPLPPHAVDIPGAGIPEGADKAAPTASDEEVRWVPNGEVEAREAPAEVADPAARSRRVPGRRSTVVAMPSDTKPTITIPDSPPPGELQIEDIEVGEGPEAVAGRSVSVHYVGASWSTVKTSTRRGGADNLMKRVAGARPQPPTKCSSCHIRATEEGKQPGVLGHPG